MITLLNAAPNTGNQGVSALCFSAVDGLAARGCGPIAVADHGRGRRKTEWRLGGEARGVDLFGLSHTRRLWRGDCLRTARFLARLGGLGSPSASIIANSKAILDVSGGDSFTDLYGEKRFGAMVLCKRLALDNNIPLILLPQTLGPFREAEKKAEAVEIMRGAAAIFVRDQKSYDFLKAELGADFDPARHQLGVDMAVLLPMTSPETPLPAQIEAWMAEDRGFPVAGLNVSGLLCQDGPGAQKTFGLAADHNHQINAAARAVLADEPNMRLLLVPHVIRPPTDPESDWAACRSLADHLDDEFGDRVAVLPQDYNATELKWIISRLDWFAGARMHATIGGFSSGVPTLGLGYSDKAAGVFAQCGIGAHVAEMRELDAKGVGEAVAASVRNRAEMKSELEAGLADIKARAAAQMDAIAAVIKAGL